MARRAGVKYLEEDASGGRSRMRRGSRLHELDNNVNGRERERISRRRGQLKRVLVVGGKEKRHITRARSFAVDARPNQRRGARPIPATENPRDNSNSPRHSQTRTSSRFAVVYSTSHIYYILYTFVAYCQRPRTQDCRVGVPAKKSRARWNSILVSLSSRYAAVIALNSLVNSSIAFSVSTRCL